MKALINSDMNYNLIAPTSLYPWPWIGVVDKFGFVEWLTIGMNFAGADSEPVLANNTCGSPFLVVGTDAVFTAVQMSKPAPTIVGS